MTATTTVRPNLFAKAAKKESTSKAKEKREVVLSEREHPGISEKMIRLADVRGELKSLEAESTGLEVDVKTEVIQTYLDVCREEGRTPESFKVKGERGGQFLLIVMDRYAKVPDETRANQLREAYGEDVVTKTETFVFNNVLLNEHMELISNAITTAVEESDLSDDVKNRLIEKLIQKEEKFAVSDGALERLPKLGEDKQGSFLFDIQPVVQLKVC